MIPLTIPALENRVKPSLNPVLMPKVCLFNPLSREVTSLWPNQRFGDGTGSPLLAMFTLEPVDVVASGCQISSKRPRTDTSQEGESEFAQTLADLPAFLFVLNWRLGKRTAGTVKGTHGSHCFLWRNPCEGHVVQALDDRDLLTKGRCRHMQEKPYGDNTGQ